MNRLDSIPSFEGDSILSFSSFWRVTALNVDRANTAAPITSKAASRSLSKRMACAPYVSIDRVREDQASRIAESMKAERIELWDKSRLRKILRDIYGLILKLKM